MIRPASSHVIDAAVMPAFGLAWFADPSHIMAAIMFVVGLSWYGVQFYDRFFKKPKRVPVPDEPLHPTD